MRPSRRTPVVAESLASLHCDVPTRLRLLQHSPLFAGLPPAAVADVNQQCHEHGYTAGAWLYLAGEPAERLSVVAVGKVKLIRPTPAGRDVLLDIVTAGEFFGSLAVLGDTIYRDSAQAQTDCCILSVTAAAFQAILRRYPPVALAALERVAARLRSVQDVVGRQGVLSAEQRIAATLLRLAERLGERRDDVLLVNMPLSRQDLADMAGTTVETASRVMSRFRQEGLVRSGRRWVAIVDRPRLARIANGHER